MNTVFLFKIFNTAILVPWAAMIIFPQQSWTKQMVRSKWPIIILAFSYLILMVVDMLVVQAGMIDFMSFDSIKTAFSREEVLLIGWLHYLAFDLFVGMWEYEQAQSLNISRWLLMPCLVATLMFGPVGLLLFLIIKSFVVRSTKKGS